MKIDGDVTQREKNRDSGGFPTWQEIAFFSGVVSGFLMLDCVLLKLKVSADATSIQTGDPFPLAISEGFVLAAFFSQLVVLAIWTALFPWSNLFRLLIGSLLLVVSAKLMVAFATRLSLNGYLLRSAGGMTRNLAFVSPLLLLTVVFFAVQLPFWMLRSTVGLHIYRKGALRLRLDRQLTITQCLGLTTIVAAILAMAQPDLELFGFRSYLLAVVPLTLLALAYGLSYLWASLGSSLSLRAVLILVIATTVLQFGGSSAFCRIEQVRPGERRYVVAAFLAVQVATLVVGFSTGLVARAMGYRLGRRSHNETVTSMGER